MDESAPSTTPRLVAVIHEPAAEQIRSAGTMPKLEALSGLLSGISFDWARQEHAPQGQDFSRSQQMQLTAPVLAWPEMASMSRRKSHCLSLAA